MIGAKLSLAMAYLCVKLIFFIFLIPISAVAQNNNGSVPMGSTLTASETSNSFWLSPSGDFAFGFKQLQDKTLFLLSIWFHKIPDKTVVWYVNSIDPVPSGSTVKLDAQTGLELRDPRGVPLWSTNVRSNRTGHGFMNDTGNFILKGSDDNWLWESFKFPADTILPNQELAIGTSLNSRRSEANFSQGRFYLRFREDGNLVLTTRSVPTNVNDDAEYYNSETSDSGDSLNSSCRVIFDSRGSMYMLKGNNQTKQLSPISIPLALENYHRATLDFDGVFTHYFHPRTGTGNITWETVWSMPDNICFPIIANKGSGACGYNNICSLKNGRPVCECPEGYRLLDPDDKYGSCMPNSSLSYGQVEQGSAQKHYDFVVIDNIDWPHSDFEQINPSTESVSRQSCLEDCFCAAAIFRSSRNSCWKKKLPLSNGRVDRRLNSKAFVKYRKSDVPLVLTGSKPKGHETLIKYRKSDAPPVLSGSNPKGQETLILLRSLLLGGSFLLNLIFIATACLAYLRYKK